MHWQSNKTGWLSLVVLFSILFSSCGGPAPTGGVAPTGGAATPTQAQQALAAITPAATVTTAPLPQAEGPLPPSVVAWQPGESQELALDGALEITFDRAMDANRVEQAFKMIAADGATVEGKFSWPAKETLRFQPASPLAGGSMYRVQIGVEAQDDEGVALANPLQLSFTTASRLQVSQVFPGRDAQAVAADTPITVIFNRPVVALAVDQDPAGLPNPLVIDPPVKGKGEWVSTSVYAFQPEVPLASATTYEVRVPAGLADASGDPAAGLAEDASWKFNTAAPQAYLASEDGRSIKKNVRLDQVFRLEFTSAMKPATLAPALKITDPDGNVVPVSLRWSSNNFRVVIKPLVKLKLATTYTLKLEATVQAQNGGMLAKGLIHKFTTLPYPAVLSIKPGDQGWEKPLDRYQSQLEIRFASPMNARTLLSRLVIAPQIDVKKNCYYYEYESELRCYGLKPSTKYEVRLKAGMADMYGNAIKDERLVRFYNGAARPYAHLYGSYLQLYSSQSKPEFFAAYMNVEQVKFAIYPMGVDEFIQWSKLEYEDKQTYQPEAGTPVWSLEQKSEGKPDQEVMRSYSFVAQDKPLAPGIYYLRLTSPSLKDKDLMNAARVLFVANANLTFKMGAGDGLLWLTDLQSGAPLAGVPLNVYDREGKQLVTDKTDAQGVLHMKLPAMEKGSEERFALSQDGKVFAIASSNWQSAYGFSLWDVPRNMHPPEEMVGYLYTERPIYRPGQPVYFKGILRKETDLSYSLPEESKVDVVIESYKGEVYRQTLSLSPYGSFEGKFALDAQAELGDYRVTVFRGENKPSVAGTSFTVAEYRPLQFAVEVTTEASDILAGQTFAADISAEYLSGGAVSGAEANWTLSVERSEFVPGQDLADFSFFSFSDYRPLKRSGQIASGKFYLDENGKYHLTLPAEYNQTGVGQRFVLEVTVGDAGGNLVSNQVAVTAHPGKVYVGVRPLRYVNKVDEEAAIEVAAVDWHGKPAPDSKVDAEIILRRWYSIQQQDERGYVRWISNVKEVPVQRFTAVAVDEKGRATLRFTPKEGGSYVARVRSRDAEGRPAEAGAYLWVSDRKYVSWQQEGSKTIELVSDRKSYRPGDTAEIMIPTPFQGEAYALVTVERSSIRKWEVVKLTSNSTVYHLPVTEDMAPVVHVSVLVMKGADADNPRPTFVMGSMPLKVDLVRKQVTVKLTPDRTQAGPREQVTYKVQTLDADGKPVDAEVSLSLSDLGTLMLKERVSPPILDYFYSERQLEISTAVPLALLVDLYNEELQKQAEESARSGSGGGGKGGGAEGVFEVRQDFPDTAFWSAQVRTGESGETSVTVTLPDNLTTWRMEARAVTSDTRVGEATVDLTSTKPLLVRPQTPRFFIAGDRVVLGAILQNNTNQLVQVEATLEAKGVTLSGKPVQKVDLPAKEQRYITWEATVPADAERVDLVFRAQGGEYSDASRPTLAKLEGQGLPVYRYVVPETASTSGMLNAAGARSEAVLLPNRPGQQGELTVKVSSSLVGGLSDGLNYLEHYPYECMEQTVSRFLPNVVTSRALQEAGVENAELKQKLDAQIEVALQRIASQQNDDGGWGWWPYQDSRPLTSAYVLLGLNEALAADYSVDTDVRERGIEYLKNNLIAPSEGQLRHELNQQAFLLYVLSLNGQEPVDEAVALYDQRQNMDLYARAYLAQVLAAADKDDPRIQTLVSDFVGAGILTASGMHWEEQSDDYWNWNTNLRTTAIILNAMVDIDPENALNANAVRWLMSNRSAGGHWGSTQQTAWTLMALVNWMTVSGDLKPQYSFALDVNDVRKLDGQADPQKPEQVSELRMAVSELLTGKPNKLSIGRGEGDGSLYYTASLEVTLPVSEVKALNKGIILSRAYYPPKDLLRPVRKAQLGDLLVAQLTVVAPTDLYYVLIDDPLPAGLEAVDQTLRSSPKGQIPDQLRYDDFFHYGWGWWYFDHAELRDERVVLSASWLPAGTYIYTYLVRAGTPGTFQVIPPSGQEFYFPEVYGRGDGSTFEVTP